MTTKGVRRKPGETVRLTGTTLNVGSFSQQRIVSKEITGSAR